MREVLKQTVKKAFRLAGLDISKARLKGVEINTDWLRHFLYLRRVYDLIKTTEGDIVECGIGYGNSFFMLAFLCEAEGLDRVLWGFDSFEGFPEPSELDRSPRNPKKGEWKVSTPESIYALLHGGMVGKEFIQRRIRIIPGFFDQSLRGYGGKSIAFLHLDVDLYQSYKTCLEYFWPRVARGGVVAFDEYRQPGALRAFPGASKAIDEFLGERRSLIQRDPVLEKYYLVKE